MINASMTIDQAFDENAKLFQYYEQARKIIKEFPFQEYLHVGFGAGALKSNELTFNLEYSFVPTYCETQFKGYFQDKDTKQWYYTAVPYEWINDVIKSQPTLIDFQLKYRIDKDEWTIKPKCVCMPSYINRKVFHKMEGKRLIDYNVKMVIQKDGEDDCIYNAVQKLIGYSAKCKAANAVARKTNDISFFKNLYTRLIPAIKKDSLFEVLQLVQDAKNNRAIKIL